MIKYSVFWTNRRSRQNKKQWKAETVDIQLRDLSFSYDEQRTILKHVYMQLKPGQFTAIVGESGSGQEVRSPG